MSGLEYLTSLVVTFAVIGFFVAWESESNFSKHLRHQARLTGWLMVGVLAKPIGWTLGFATVLALLAFPSHERLLKYWQRRTWRPAH